MLQWVLGIASAVIWLVPVTWFYRRELLDLWRSRNDKWFKDPF